MTRNFKISLHIFILQILSLLGEEKKKSHYFSQGNDRCATSALETRELLLAQMINAGCCWILSTAISFIFAVKIPRSIADY